MAEMSRFAVAKGANPITFLGLAGMGDLMATCTSTLSRNFQLGELLAEDLSLSVAKEKVGQVAEGAPSATCPTFSLATDKERSSASNSPN